VAKAANTSPRVPTGNSTLDTALGGGIPYGSTLLVEGEEGAGATEFAMTVLRTVAVERGGESIVRFISALRSAPRVTRELAELFEQQKEVEQINVRVIRPRQVEADCVLSILDMGSGSVLVIESASALARTESGKDLLALIQLLGDRAAESGVVVILLHTPGTIPESVESSLGEAADGVLSFQWLDSGPSRRRLLRIKKMRGLAPVLDGEQIPVFEVGLHRGRGFDISKVKSVI
jgi:KaiC/GvpD/RAD55 family RecA-like ATPase